MEAPSIVRVVAADLDSLRAKVKRAWEARLDDDDPEGAEDLAKAGKSIEGAYEAVHDLLDRFERRKDG